MIQIQNTLPVMRAVLTYRMRYFELSRQLPPCCAARGAAHFVSRSAPVGEDGRPLVVSFDSERSALLLAARGPQIWWVGSTVGYPPTEGAPSFAAVIGGEWCAVVDSRSGLSALRDINLDARKISEVDFLLRTRSVLTVYPWIHFAEFPGFYSPGEADHSCVEEADLETLGSYDLWNPDYSLLPSKGAAQSMGLTR